MHISLYRSMNITANSVYAFYVIYNLIHKFVYNDILGNCVLLIL